MFAMSVAEGNAPQVSVLMAIYDGERYLRDAVQSVLDQTFVDFEFIVVNDGSTDGSGAILEEMSARDSRMVILNRNHEGMARSWNAGIAVARGEYLARQDADDISLPERLGRQVDSLDRGPGVSLVGTFVRCIDENGQPTGDLVLPVTHEEIRETMAADRYAVISNTFMMRRSAVLALGGYRFQFPIAEDTDFELRFSERFRVANLPEVFYLYRRSTESITIRRRHLRRLYIDIARELAQQRASEGKDLLM